MQAKPDFVILIWPSVKKQGGPFRRLSKDGHYLHQNEQIGRTQQRAVMGWRWKYQHQRSDSDFFRWYGCFRGVCVTWMPRLMQPSLLVHFRLEMLCKEFCIAQSSNRRNICDKLTPKTNTIMSVYQNHHHRKQVCTLYMIYRAPTSGTKQGVFMARGCKKKQTENSESWGYVKKQRVTCSHEQRVIRCSKFLGRKDEKQ